ncbi:MAG: site-specific integrase [Nitrososphaerota archaeon]
MDTSEDRLKNYEGWLREAQGLSRSTIASYMSHARVLETVRSSLGRDEIDLDVIVKAIEQYSMDSTKSQFRVGIRKYLSFLGLKDLIDSVKVSAARYELEWWWSVEDVKKIFNACRRDVELVIVSFAYLQAMRRSEITSVRVSDIDLKNEIVRVRAAKKSGLHFIPKQLYRGGEWWPDQVALLERHISENGMRGDDRVVPYSKENLNYIFRGIVRRAGVRPAGLHMLRHSRAAHLRSSGVPIDVLSRFLGHVNIATTMIYAHIGPEELLKSIPPPA